MQQKKNRHMSELIFTITLFSLFMISGVLLVLFGANVYQKITSESSSNETIRTSLSYIQEKVRQSDHENSIQVESHNDYDTLSLHSTYGTEDYVTYIYYDNGTLKELFTKSSAEFQPSAGDIITDIHAFSIKKDGTLIQMTLTDTDDQAHTLYVHGSSQNDIY